MSNLFWLTDVQMERLRPFFPKSHGRPPVDDPPPGNGLSSNRERGRILGGIIFVNRNGLRWCDAPRKYGPAKTLYNRWKRWGDKGIFALMMHGLAEEAAVPKAVMIDATYPACGQKGGADDQRGRLMGRTKGGMNTKLHAVTPSRGLLANHCRAMDADGRPIRFFMTAGQVSDYTGAAALLGGLPAAEWLLGDRGYDADWFRDALKDKGIRPCIPGRKSRSKPVKYDKLRYKRRNRLLAHVTMRCQVTHRNHVRAFERLAKGCDPLRQMPKGILIGSSPRSHSAVLAMK